MSQISPLEKELKKLKVGVNNLHHEYDGGLNRNTMIPMNNGTQKPIYKIVPGDILKGNELDQVCWGRKNLLEEAKDIPPIRDFVLPPSDPIAPYFADIMKERFGFGSAYLVFKNAEPIAAFKANTRNKIIEVKDYEGSEKAWRIVKEFAWEHQMPLQTELRIGGKRLK